MSKTAGAETSLEELAKIIRPNRPVGCEFLPGIRRRTYGESLITSNLLTGRPIFDTGRFTNAIPPSIVKRIPIQNRGGMEITKALAALRPLYGKGNVEIVTTNGHRVRGIVRSMKTTQALSTPTVKVERADGEVIKIPFTAIVEIINHNRSV